MVKELSNQAAAAKCIRAELKKTFPSVAFKVTSASFSMGDSVAVSWIDGPTSAQVNAITRKYQYGHFDGMIDLYEYSNRRNDIPQSKFVQVRRDYSNDAHIAAIKYVNKRFGWALRYSIETQPAFRKFAARTWVKIDQESNQHTGHGWQGMEVDSVLHNADMVCRHCSAATLPGDVYCPQCGRVLAELESVA